MMRSRLGVMGRFAAHVTALALLALMLIYISPPDENRRRDSEPLPQSAPAPGISAPDTPAAPAPTEIAGVPAAPETPDAAAPTPAEPAAPAMPAPEPAPPPAIPAEILVSDESDDPIAPAESGMPPAEPGESGKTAAPPEPARPGDETADGERSETPLAAFPDMPESVTGATPAPERADDASPTPAAANDTTPADAVSRPVAESPDLAPPPEKTEPDPAASASESDPAVRPSEALTLPIPDESEPEPVVPPPPVSAEPAHPVESRLVEQPDESGSLAAAEPDARPPLAAAAAIAGAALEVLGDGVYWLDAARNPADELPSLPDNAVLVLLTPDAAARPEFPAGFRTAILPAGLDDITADATAHFIRLTSGASVPAVVAALPGAKGAAFFKGAYLLVNRNLDAALAIRDIEPELDAAGDGRDEIIHRLLRLDARELGRMYGDGRPAAASER